MTLARFATKNAFRNRRRSLLTSASIAFSLLLLTLLVSVYRGFYIDQGSQEANLRLATRNRVSLVMSMPSFYREKIRAVPGVLQVAPYNWFGGLYKDDKPENFFPQFATDPNEVFKIFTDFKMPREQMEAFQRDRAGCAVDKKLADRYGWKLGDRVVLKGTIYPLNPELTIRAIFQTEEPFGGLLFNAEYIEQALPQQKGRTGFFYSLADAPGHVASIAQEIDDTFQNSPQRTKTESEKAFALSFVSMLGNVKLFIMSITLAVVFTTLLVSANTLAMTIRERTREVAVLKTLGFTRGAILSLYVGEAVTISLVGGAVGTLAAYFLLMRLAKTPNGTFFGGFSVNAPTAAAALAVAAAIGFLSAIFPAYQASRRNIVDGLRHIG